MLYASPARLGPQPRRSGSSASATEQRHVCLLLLGVSTVAGSLLLLLRWQMITHSHLLDVAGASGLTANTVPQTRVITANHELVPHYHQHGGGHADGGGLVIDSSSSSTTTSSSSATRATGTHAAVKATGGHTPGATALGAALEAYEQRSAVLGAALDALRHAVFGTTADWAHGAAPGAGGGTGTGTLPVHFKWTYDTPLPPPQHAAGGTHRSRAAAADLPVRVALSPLKRLPGAPASAYEAVMRTAGGTPIGHLPRPRDRPGAAASPGSFRLPWLDLPADEAKRSAVGDAARHAWQGYVAYAWGKDELQPLSRGGKNSFGGLGATIVDSLDTLWVLNMTTEFESAKQWVAQSLTFDKDFEASVFETTIRVIGGLLSAAHLSGDQLFVAKAKEAADKLAPAFDASPSGIPLSVVNLRTGKARNSAWARSESPLAEFGSTQLEMCALSDATGDASYGERAESVIRMLLAANGRLTGQRAGLWPVWLDPKTNSFVSPSRVTFGGLGDSFYEYLLKMWLAGGQTEALAPYRHLWEEAMESMLAELVFTSSPGNWTYVAELDRETPVHRMDHLACFVPGMLALGAAGDVAQRYLALAADLAHTCVAFYDAMPTGLSPESLVFRAGQDFNVAARGGHNLHRPETVESLFYLWRRTGDQQWRDAGWRIFTALEEQERQPGGGYTGLKDVRVSPGAVRDDTQQSFFLAETLKYLYLLFSDSAALDLDAWVLNTEAHPLKVTKRDTSLLAEASDSSSSSGSGVARPL